MNKIKALLGKDLLVEFRNTFSISSVLLYVCASIYVIYASFINIQPQVWNVLFWIVFLFISVNALIRTFNQEQGSRTLYYYQLAAPVHVLIAKLVYNTIMLFVLGLLSYFFFAIVAGNPVRNFGLFILCIGMGSIGFASVFTFVAAIGAKTGNGQVLTAILGFPCVLPILLVNLKLSANALALIQDTAYTTDIIILVSIEVILVAVSIILFPYLWRE